MPSASAVADRDVVQDHVSTGGGAAAPEPLELQHARASDAVIGCRQLPVRRFSGPIRPHLYADRTSVHSKPHPLVVTDATPANDPKLVVTPARDFHSCTVVMSLVICTKYASFGVPDTQSPDARE